MSLPFWEISVIISSLGKEILAPNLPLTNAVSETLQINLCRAYHCQDICTHSWINTHSNKVTSLNFIQAYANKCLYTETSFRALWVVLGFLKIWVTGQWHSGGNIKHPFLNCLYPIPYPFPTHTHTHSLQTKISLTPPSLLPLVQIW